MLFRKQVALISAQNKQFFADKSWKLNNGRLKFKFWGRSSVLSNCFNKKESERRQIKKKSKTSNVGKNDHLKCKQSLCKSSQQTEIAEDSLFVCRKNILEVPKLDFDFSFDGKFYDFGNNFDSLSQRLNQLKLSLSSSLPQLPQLPALPQVTLPQVTLPQLPDSVSLSIESIRKVEVYAYLLRTLQHFVLFLNTLSFFNLNLNLNLTTQLNATISNFYCFMNQVRKIPLESCASTSESPLF